MDGNRDSKALEITPARLEQLCAEHDRPEELCDALQELAQPPKATYERVDSVRSLAWLCICIAKHSKA